MRIEFLYGSIFIYQYFKVDDLFDIGHSEPSLQCDLHWDSDYNCTLITGHLMNPHTAKIPVDNFVKIMKRLYALKPFTRINYVDSNYVISEKELMKLILQK